MRVDLCGTTLTGLAATWYADEVEAWNRKTRKWYFENLICSMYKQFIHEVTMQIPILRLEKPATLQLGCLGSRLKINFATIAVVEFSSTTTKNYLDIVNLDKYDCILETPFLRKHGISLDFQFQDIVIHRKLCIPTLPEGGHILDKTNSTWKMTAWSGTVG